MSQLIETLIPITFFASVLIGFLFFLRYRNSERLALIDKAADPEMFKTGSFKFPWLKVGLLFAGLGIGILVGSFLQNLFTAFEDTGIVFSMFLFGGLAMVLAAKLESNKTEQLN